MEDLEKLQIAAIEMNKPLVNQETFEEHAFGIKMSAFAVLGVVAAFLCNFHLAAFLFGIVIVEALVLSRFNVLAIQKQIAINTKAILTKTASEDNTYQRIIDVLQWILVATFTLGMFAFFVK